MFMLMAAVGSRISRNTAVVQQNLAIRQLSTERSRLIRFRRLDQPLQCLWGTTKRASSRGITLMGVDPSNVILPEDSLKNRQIDDAQRFSKAKLYMRIDKLKEPEPQSLRPVDANDTRVSPFWKP